MKDEPLKEVLEYWPLIGGVVAFIAGYADLKSDQRSLRRDVDAFANRHDRERAEDNARTHDMLKEIRVNLMTLVQRSEK